MSKFTSIVLLLMSCACFSQMPKWVQGKVSYQDSYQKNVDVINFNTKKITQTSTAGEFSIEAKVGDVLIFMSENFADQKYTVTAADIEKKVLIVKLVDKPIALEEVEIAQVKAIKVGAVSYNDLKMAKIQKDATRPKNKDVYTGEIENGIDFVQIGKLIGTLFKKKEKPTATAADTLSFTEYAKANFNPSFFSKTLKLKPAQTARFLEYCQADPKSKAVIKTHDELAILEFLLAKKAEFVQLK